MEITFNLDWLSKAALEHLLQAALTERDDYSTAPELTEAEHEELAQKARFIATALIKAER